MNLLVGDTAKNIYVGDRAFAQGVDIGGRQSRSVIVIGSKLLIDVGHISTAAGVRQVGLDVYSEGPAVDLSLSKPSNVLVKAFPASSILRIWFPRQSEPTTLVESGVPLRIVKGPRDEQIHVIVNALGIAAVGEILTFDAAIKIIVVPLVEPSGLPARYGFPALRVKGLGDATQGVVASVTSPPAS